MAATISTEAPPVTRHAGNRWDERTAPDSVAPETAWQHSQRIDAGAPFQSVDVRYHHGSDTLLLRMGGVINTVYAVDGLESEEYHAVKHALPEEARR